MDDRDIEDASVLERPSIPVTFRGETLNVGPLEIRQFPPFTRVIRYASPALMRVYSAIGADDGGFEAAFLDLVADHGETLIMASAIAVDRDASWIEKGTVDELLSLVMAIVEVNRDFFVRKVVPMLRQVRSQGATESSGDGAGPTASTT